MNDCIVLVTTDISEEKKNPQDKGFTELTFC